jgi:hypothetical protein
MQARIDRQHTDPCLPRAERLAPVAADLAQDGELLLVEPGDRGRRTDVGRTVGGDAFALAGALFTTSDGRILCSPVSTRPGAQRPSKT